VEIDKTITDASIKCAKCLGHLPRYLACLKY
jgi:hypothetical protein